MSDLISGESRGRRSAHLISLVLFFNNFQILSRSNFEQIHEGADRFFTKTLGVAVRKTNVAPSDNYWISHEPPGLTERHLELFIRGVNKVGKDEHL